jgi:DNA-binding response OmpR family regulator
MPDEVTSALRAGANDYWTKPLDYDAFIYDMAVLLRQATPA